MRDKHAEGGHSAAASILTLMCQFQLRVVKLACLLLEHFYYSNFCDVHSRLMSNFHDRLEQITFRCDISQLISFPFQLFAENWNERHQRALLPHFGICTEGLCEV